MKDDPRKGERSLFPTIPIYIQFTMTMINTILQKILFALGDLLEERRIESCQPFSRSDYRLKMFHEIRAPSSRLLSCATAMWFFSTGEGGRHFSSTEGHV